MENNIIWAKTKNGYLNEFEINPGLDISPRLHIATHVGLCRQHLQLDLNQDESFLNHKKNDIFKTKISHTLFKCHMKSIG